MLTAEEEKFVTYWEEQRKDKKAFLKKLSIGLPLIALAAVCFFINLASGWFGKAEAELRQNASLIIVIVVAVIATVVFISLFSVRQKWEQNEADYQGLLKKRAAVPDRSATSV